ncbi:MAG: sigma-70 family RNA polymerase sigma factor [Verrucomicrobiota bacterium]|nr:sigma-70 family RNA polymerase sigma factor [Verrucomicrobiota bacterium]
MEKSSQDPPWLSKVRSTQNSELNSQPDGANQVTRILQDWGSGDGDAAARLMPLVYDELRHLARDYLRRERGDHTLQPTALVHEAYLRLVDDDARATWQNRAHFYGIAARLMRRILVDHARSHNAAKRGGLEQKVMLEEARMIAPNGRPDLVALDGALQNLARVYPRKSEVVELKFFGGLEAREIAEVLQVSEKTVLRDWSFAKLWLTRELESSHAA